MKTFAEIFGAEHAENEAHYRATLTPTFTTKEEYLKWVQEWKAENREIIAAIRQAKSQRKRFLRTNGKITGSNPEWDASAADSRNDLRQQAREHYMHRFFAKELAKKQRDEAIAA